MRLGFVVQRYGEQVNGGAEYHCRQIAERLAHEHDVQVFTTCANNYQTWANHFPAGVSISQKVHVHRFPVRRERVPHFFDALYDFLVHFYYFTAYGQQLFPSHCSGSILADALSTTKNSKKPHAPWWLHCLVRCRYWFMKCLRHFLELWWMRHQGPVTPELIKAVKSQSRSLDAIFFFSYTYRTTFSTLPSVSKKSILIPTAHDDPCFGFEIFKRLFKASSALIYQTEEEKELVESRFPITRKIPHTITAIGIEAKKISVESSKEFLRGLKVVTPYILYVGRIEEAKSCQDLINHFISFCAKRSSSDTKIQLVLAGQLFMEPIIHERIRYVGFVSEQEKWALLQQSLVVVMPSCYESLSIVCLEAWAAGRPVLANGLSPVLEGQCRRSHAGRTYHNGNEFCTELGAIIDDPNYASQLGFAGKSFVEKHYQWSSICEAYIKAAQSI